MNRSAALGLTLIGVLGGGNVTLAAQEAAQMADMESVR